MKIPLTLSLALIIPVAAAWAMQRAPAPAAQPVGATPRVVTAANAFLASLDDAQRTAASFAFNSPQRTGWSNLPGPMFQRKGLRLGDLMPPQRDAAMALVSATLSREGYKKVLDIMNGDEVLKNSRGGRTGGRGGGVQFGRDEYYIALLGAPSATAPWLIQFGGHHLAINVTVVGANNVLTPSLPAAQPARYMLNGQTIRPLGDENDKAFALINALDAGQQKQAILNYRVSDLVLGPGEDGKTIQPEGILASALTASQQTMLLDIAHEWVGILNDEAAAAQDGGAEGQPAEDLLRLERRHEEWRARVLPHPGTDGGHRVRAAAGRSRPHPYDLSGSDQRLRREARRAMSTRHLVWSCVVIGWLWAAAPAGAHRLDEYLQATRIGVNQIGSIWRST